MINIFSLKYWLIYSVVVAVGISGILLISDRVQNWTFSGLIRFKTLLLVLDRKGIIPLSFSIELEMLSWKRSISVEMQLQIHKSIYQLNIITGKWFDE